MNCGRSRYALWPAVMAAVGLAAVVAAAAVLPFGPLSAHMMLHIALMNGVAPLVATAVASAGQARTPSGGALAAATAAQVAAVWLAHAPAVLTATMHAAAVHLVVQALLLGVATWFWVTVLQTRGAGRWRALLALLLTGKLLCLLGVLLLFAPRGLYAMTHGALLADALADQQLAGLLMLIACPLTYVLAGVVIAARWVGELARDVPAQPA